MTSMLNISGLNRAYPGFQLKDINLCLQPGSILGLIGPNGAGKTTLMKLIMGQIRPGSGSLQVFGLGYPAGLKEIRNRIGFVPEEPPFQGNSQAGDVSTVGRNFYKDWDSSRFFQLLEEFAIDSGQRIRELSRGRKSLLSLALALSHKADLLLLDEPAANLDARGRRKVIKLMSEFTAEEDKAVIISTHQTEGLGTLVDRLAFLHQGSLVLENETDDLMASWKWIHYRDGALDPDIEQSLVCGEQGSFGNRGLLSSYPKYRKILEQGQIADEIQISPASVDDILISLTEGK